MAGEPEHVGVFSIGERVGGGASKSKRRIKIRKRIKSRRRIRSRKDPPDPRDLLTAHAFHNPVSNT